MTDGSATVGASLRAGLSDMAGAVRDCWGALAFATVLGAGATLLPPVLKLPAVLVAGVIAHGALFRRAFGREAGFKGLRWGRDEWRLLAAQLMILGLLLLIGAILAVIVFGVALGVARTSAPDFDVSSAAAARAALAAAGPAGVAVAMVALASLAIMIWLWLRLSLSAPATVAQSGVRVLSAFPLTRGRASALFVTWVAIVVPFGVVSALLRGAPGPGPLSTAALALATYFYLMPAWAGSLAYVYRHSAVSQDA